MPYLCYTVHFVCDSPNDVKAARARGKLEYFTLQYIQKKRYLSKYILYITIIIK